MYIVKRLQEIEGISDRFCSWVCDFKDKDFSLLTVRFIILDSHSKSLCDALATHFCVWSFTARYVIIISDFDLRTVVITFQNTDTS